MRILVICGECIQVNTSSNLCGLAYLHGLIDAGHDVTLISADGRDYIIDSSMTIPEGVKSYTYYSTSLYEKLSLKKKRTVSQPRSAVDNGSNNLPKRKRSNLKSIIKKAVFSLYGPHGIYLKFAFSASRFRSNEPYDVVISLCTPASSHLLAYKLLKSGHIQASHWIQIWEDPWYGEESANRSKSIYREEKRLLDKAERVCYVSPLTLQNQKKLFPEYSEKMFWVPLPAYRTDNDAASHCEIIPGLYGYFGDYNLPVRDLEPFYRAAVNCRIEANICGNSNQGFASTDRLKIYPRIPLNVLKPIEAKTEVLVFLCNSRGGQIPGKIYQYAATNKIILFILDGTEEEKATLRAFFDPFHRFVFCENTVDDIEIAIKRIGNDDLNGIKNVSLTDFEPKMIVQQILEKGIRQ